MSNYESLFENINKKKVLPENKNNLQDSLNKKISLFQDDLTQNINLQYKKEWKKLSKDCKIKLLLNYCNINNITNFYYLKKFMTKLVIDYDKENMIILNINNIIKIENKEQSSSELQIKNLKIKPNKKSLNNTPDIELSEDI